MKEFRCNKCLHWKKPDLLAYTENSKQGKRNVCTSCSARMSEVSEIKESGVK